MFFRILNKMLDIVLGMIFFVVVIVLVVGFLVDVRVLGLEWFFIVIIF